MGSAEEAQVIAAKIVASIERERPGEHPMQVTAAVAFALGAMVASMAATGITKPGRSGQLLEHLFQMAEHVASEGLAAA